MRVDLNKIVDTFADTMDDHITSFTQTVREQMDKDEAELKQRNNDLITALNQFRTDVLSTLAGTTSLPEVSDE